jgi:DNA topoisomerase I
MAKLVIVESPTKAKTLAKILDKNYNIQASMGHIRDLPKKGLGVDIENNFEPTYEIPEKAKKTSAALKKAIKDAESVVLATDPDREGEAIAWHLQHILKSTKEGKKLNYSRVVFHELTKDAVLKAFSHQDELNLALVDSQQARRILDRLVGYKLSPLLWKKVRYGLSAGRVQSVAVRLIVERERERTAFVPEEYWSIEGLFSSQEDKKKQITATLEKKDDKKIEVKDEKTAKKIEADLNKANFEITSIEKTQRNKNPYAPYKTSTLQQAMANVFGVSASKTMSAAQKLFEQGYITYHRTDSLNLSPQFVNSARSYAKSKFGESYIPEKGVFYKTKSKNAQEAHEAIRPTDLILNPLDTKIKKLGTDAYKVYLLVWKRALESQMVAAVYDQTTIKVTSDNGYLFKAVGSIIKFDGWLAVEKYLNSSEEIEELVELPVFDEGEKMDLQNLKLDQHFTQPPARYSDASLIKKLEELGIGRPSTYAPTISTITARGYVEREGRYFLPKDVAYVVIDLLVEHFPEIVGYEFTANLEEELDSIAEGKKEWVPVIKNFYGPFEKTLAKKDKELHKKDVTNLGETDEKCPECNHNLVIKLGKYGKFLSCSNYPTCEYARPMEEDIPLDANGKEVDFGKCPECEDGVFVLRQGRFGKFLACSNYPKCKTAKPFLDKVGINCPKCDEGEVVVKKARGRVFYGCSRYPECDYANWKNPMDELAKGKTIEQLKEDANKPKASKRAKGADKPVKVAKSVKKAKKSKKASKKV